MSKKYKKLIQKSVDSMICAWCDKQMMSKSGKTLHQKSCKELQKAQKFINNVEVDQTMRINGKKHKIVYVDINHCLVVLENNEVHSPTKIQSVKKAIMAEKKKNRPKPFFIARAGQPQPNNVPNNIEKWLKLYIDLWKSRGYSKKRIMEILPQFFKVSSFIKHKRWAWDKDTIKIAKKLMVNTK